MEYHKSIENIRPIVTVDEITGIMLRSGETDWVVVYHKNPFPCIKITKPYKRLAEFLIDMNVPFYYTKEGSLEISIEYVQLPIIKENVI